MTRITAIAASLIAVAAMTVSAVADEATNPSKTTLKSPVIQLNSAQTTSDPATAPVAPDKSMVSGTVRAGVEAAKPAENKAQLTRPPVIKLSPAAQSQSTNPPSEEKPKVGAGSVPAQPAQVQNNIADPAKPPTIDNGNPAKPLPSSQGLAQAIQLGAKADLQTPTVNEGKSPSAVAESLIQPGKPIAAQNPAPAPVANPQNGALLSPPRLEAIAADNQPQLDADPSGALLKLNKPVQQSGSPQTTAPSTKSVDRGPNRPTKTSLPTAPPRPAGPAATRQTGAANPPSGTVAPGTNVRVNSQGVPAAPAVGQPTGRNGTAIRQTNPQWSRPSGRAVPSAPGGSGLSPAVQPAGQLPSGPSPSRPQGMTTTITPISQPQGRTTTSPQGPSVNTKQGSTPRGFSSTKGIPTASGPNTNARMQPTRQELRAGTSDPMALPPSPGDVKPSVEHPTMQQLQAPAAGNPRATDGAVSGQLMAPETNAPGRPSSFVAGTLQAPGHQPPTATQTQPQ